jgi:hypothetical protein
MKYQLKRIEPLRAANIGAIVYGLFMGIFSILLLPFVLLGGLFANSAGPGNIAPVLAFGLMLFLYPIFGVVFGWISGFLMSAIYNVVVRWTGGLLLEMAAEPVAPGGEPAQSGVTPSATLEP